MTVAMLAPNRAMLISPRQVALWSPLRVPPVSGGSGTFAGPYPNAIAGMSGWWDAGLIGSALSTSGVPVSAIGSAVGSLADKSGAGAPLTVYHAATSGTASPVITPRLNGLLAGIGLNTITAPAAMAAAWQQLPSLDPDQGLALSLANLGTAAAWTLYLVWSRPNWRQSSNAPSPLLSIAGVTVLAVDNATGTGRLVLFPGVSQTVLTTAMTRRHSHAVIIRNTPGTGVSVWLDGAPVTTAATNPLSASYTGTMLFMHNGTASGGSECWFHEAAMWGVALSSANITALIACQARWLLGTRRGVRILVTGQSNAGNGLVAGAWHTLAQGIAWHLGALAYGVVGVYGGVPSTTILGSNGIYPTTSVDTGGVFPGEFLNVGGGDPSTWTIGVGGTAIATYLATQTAADLADVVAILWPWSETDCTRLYSERATYKGAATRLLALERAMLPGTPTAANMPHLWWSAIPFPYGPNNQGVQMIREVAAEMAADPTQNVTVIMPQTSDSLPNLVASFSATSGVWTANTATDNSHRDPADLITFAQRAAPVAARAILAATGGDSLPAIPSGITKTGGPTIFHVYKQSATVLIVTIQHDGGSDLIVPPTQAASGRGWAVMDGGSIASPPSVPVIFATACVRLDATHLQVTLASSLVNAAAACRLYYPYGSHTPLNDVPGIGRFDAVTDNYSTVTPPAGWDIGGDLGTSWAINQPVQAPMTITAGVASGGIVLSATPT